LRIYRINLKIGGLFKIALWKMTTAEISLGEVERTINQHFRNLDLSGVELAISAYPAMY
jgi:hypothetical protein